MKYNQLINNNAIYWIDTLTDLNQCKELLIKEPYLTFDTEFDDNRIHKGLHWCLLQIYIPNHCFLIDVIALSDNFKNIVPLQDFCDAVFLNPQCIKIGFRCERDLVLLEQYTSQAIEILDLAWLSRLDGDIDLSLQKLLQDKLNITVSKSKQLYNWYKRPLNADVQHYAAQDVIYLLELYEELEKSVRNKKRWDWWLEELPYRRSRPDSFKQEVNEDYYNRNHFEKRQKKLIPIKNHLKELYDDSVASLCLSRDFIRQVAFGNIELQGLYLKSGLQYRWALIDHSAKTLGVDLGEFK